MTEFTFSLNEQDYINYQKFNFRKSRNFLLICLVMIFYAGINIIQAIFYKRYELLLTAVLFIVFVLVILAVFYFVLLPKQVKKFVYADTGYSYTFQMNIGENEIEIKNIPKENERRFEGVYPYSVISAIYETNGYYYILIGLTIHILPKREIPPEMSDYVKNIFRTKAKYSLKK